MPLQYSMRYALYSILNHLIKKDPKLTPQIIGQYPYYL